MTVRAGPLADPLADATARQVLASRPDASAWVMASAGSGKTKVLTDRIARLLLAGARPEALLCLTYTRAAAANMQTRLHQKLAGWATTGADDLARELASFLGRSPELAETLRARSLLAVALDAPGGMRIGTIHSFAQTLLRRFPLEADVAPHFTLIDEFDRAELLRTVREEVFAGIAHDEAFVRLAKHFPPTVFGKVIGRVIEGGVLPPDRATLLHLFDLPPDATGASLMRDAVEGADAEALRRAAHALNRTDGERKRRDAILDWLSADPQAKFEAFERWRAIFLTQKGEPREPGGLITDKTEAQVPGTLAILLAEAARLVAAQQRLHALTCAEITAALAAVVAPVAHAFRAAKEARAALDYGDLIAGADRLLQEQDAAWVLYRIDGGLDHLLIDEAQDTAPEQWRIARQLTGEFFAGEGARDGAVRTVFAVGDRKQSIYSFQGTAPEHFVKAGERYRREAAGADRAFHDIELPVSFRSTQPILDLVNAVQKDWGRHLAARVGQAGSAALWPLFHPPAEKEDEHGDRLPGADHACAQAIAATIARWIGREPLPARGRTVRAGDCLVLVRSRGAFVEHLIRALKNQDPTVPVAGADRLRLTDSLAVKDCLAFLDALLLPEDDLNLAAVLKGPFCGLGEDSLMQLALGRGQRRLIAALRTRAHERPDWTRADALIEEFRARADFDDAHALLHTLLDNQVAEAATGREALIARLGEEAIEPLDELLRAALADSLRHPPSLQGFLHRLRTAGAEIKRDADTAPDAVRIMTVHGAKGLEAPIVFLADTTGMPKPPESVVPTPRGPIWLPNKAARPPALETVCEALAQRALEEHERLLYVALTRAEDRLVVTGWHPARGSLNKACWYRRVEHAFDSLAAQVTTDGDGARRITCPQTTDRPDRPDRAAAALRPASLPAWASPARAEVPMPQRIKPSGADGEPEPEATTPPFAPDSAAAARLRRGDLTHLLLQWLPTLPPAGRAEAAASWLDHHAADLSPELRAAIAAEALGVIAHPDAAPLFDPAGLSEAPIVGSVDGRPVNGVIDRLVVTPTKIWLADYKTDRDPPDRAEDAPEKYLRQLAIYRALLARLYPDRPVAALLVWTAIPRVAPLPAALLDRFAPSA